MAELDPLFLALQEAVAGRYSLERELGRGGMGVVFLARDVSLDRLVALKLLPPELASRPALRERFLREARLAARLSHPNIVPIHSVEEHGGLVWFAMAYVPGETLGARLRARGSLPPGEAARLLRDVAWALGYAHAQGVVHRDVKPDNILLEAGGRRALIADFGIAAPAEQGGEVVGTVAYLSPEQATGERVDGRSDLYALGVVGYYALSARLPYPVTSLSALIERQLAGLAPPLAEAAPHVPRALCRTIDRCLASLPSARFQTGEELAGALEQLGTGATDLPAPFRVWIQKGEQRRSPAVVISLLWSMPMLIGSMFALASGGGGSWLGLTAFIVVLLSLPWCFVLGSRILHTRKLLAAGYSHADLVLALEQHAERRREELAFEHGTTPTRVGRLVHAGIVIGTAVASLSLLLAFATPAKYEAIPIGLGVTAGGLALLLFSLRNLIPGARSGARDRWSEFALRFWRGGFGKRLTRLAGWRLGAKAAPEQLLHRPTEVALGDAAEALYRALPAAERRDLRQLPDQLRHLAAQAQHMRARIEELDDLIAQAAPTTLFEGEKAAGDGGAGALGEARALWAARLKETVTMLEALRLGLLKLHAGSATPDTLTEDLAAAHALRERLGLLLTGQAEAGQLLTAKDR
ncbi:MAG: serine/threonine protein kinase [Gemmatimonadetes bacterium]|nr:serine/threonine protein kinase [Gemmatimonadota bacterium]